MAEIKRQIIRKKIDKKKKPQTDESRDEISKKENEAVKAEQNEPTSSSSDTSDNELNKKPNSESQTDFPKITKTGNGKLTKDDAIAALSKAVDPEIQIDVWTLGLIYAIEITGETSEQRIYIKMTLTTPFCPYAPMLIQDVKNELAKTGFKEPQVEIVFDPPWEPSDELKMYLGLP